MAMDHTLNFELVNPSDPYTFTAPDLKTAAVAVVLLGRGFYGAKSLDGAIDVPVFLLGGSESWFKEHFGRTVQESVDDVPNERVAAVLDTLMLGREERSSLNNIGKSAKKLAAALRQKEKA